MKCNTMNKLISALISATLILAACATPPGQAPQTPAQIAARVCPPTQAAITSFKALNGLPADTEKGLSEVQPLVDAVCKDATTVNFTDLGALSATGLPAIIDLVKASTLSPDDQNKVIESVTAAQLVLDIALAADPALGTTPIAK